MTLLTTAAILAQSGVNGAPYRPFLDPLDVHANSWLTIFPLLFLMAMAYKACRVGDLRHYWRHVAIMFVQLILMMIALAVGVEVIVNWVVPVLERVLERV